MNIKHIRATIDSIAESLSWAKSHLRNANLEIKANRSDVSDALDFHNRSVAKNLLKVRDEANALLESLGYNSAESKGETLVRGTRVA
jgi:molecular chaperone GrpE (heat shock protein)